MSLTKEQTTLLKKCAEMAQKAYKFFTQLKDEDVLGRLEAVEKAVQARKPGAVPSPMAAHVPLPIEIPAHVSQGVALGNYPADTEAETRGALTKVFHAKGAKVFSAEITFEPGRGGDAQGRTEAGIRFVAELKEMATRHGVASMNVIISK